MPSLHDISRQPFVPAFLTLLLFAAASTMTAGGPAEGSGVWSEVRQALSFTFGADAAPAARQTITAISDPGLAIPLPEELLLRFQTAFPVWARLLSCLAILFAGISVGRITARHNLYAIGTCIAMPLYAFVACGFPTGTDLLPTCIAAALLVLSVKNFSRSFRNGYGFDPIFRGSLYLGMLLTLDPATLPFALLLPLTVMLFRRTLRETVVALFGLLLPPLLLCYVNWGAGGSFTAPIAASADIFRTGQPFELFLRTPLSSLIVPAAALLLDATAILLFARNPYFVGTKARFILISQIGILALAIATLCLPAASPSLLVLLAVPSSILMPLFFIRIDDSVTLPAYLILLAAALAGIFLR